jgi:Spy/CpxP family protein refolding chaperone
MTKNVAIGLLSLILSGLVGPASAQTASPYAGEEAREIKALSPKEVDDLVQGLGMGLAKPAELNRYPGPLHALELADELQLSAEQRNGLEASKARMSASAKALGAEILDLERELDAAFAHRKIDQIRLNELTAQIGRRQGMLRAAHLEAHIETASLLSPEQISRYDTLRGYGRASVPKGHGTMHH